MAHHAIGRARMFAADVNEMQQHAAALHMAEETVAEAQTLMGALDEAGNVRQHEFALIHAHDAQIGMERGEGIVGDLRLGGGDRGQEGRFARIGQAHEAGVRNELQAQPDGALDADLAGIGALGRAIGGGGEMQIAEAAVAAARHHIALADLGEIGDQRLVVFREDLGAHGHFHGHVVAAPARAVAAHAMHAGLGLEMLLVAIVDQRVEPIDAFDDHIAAAPAVAPIGTAEFDELLAAERHGSAAPVAGAHIDLGLVEKLHGSASTPDDAPLQWRTRPGWVRSGGLHMGRDRTPPRHGQFSQQALAAR